jgi:hypothetical protein
MKAAPFVLVGVRPDPLDARDSEGDEKAGRP